MNKFPITKSLPWLTLGAGLLSLVFRLILGTTVNDQGFFARWHWSGLAILVVTFLFLTALYCITRLLRQANKYSFNFKASIPGGICAALAAVGFGITSVRELAASAQLLDTVCAVLGLMATLALLAVAFTRWKGSHAPMLLHALLCVYLMVRLICMYRQWSSDPQLMDYVFELLALVCAMLATYHRATFDADFGQRTSFAFFSLAAVYFCLVSLGGRDALLYFAVGAWLFADRCDLTPLPRGFWEARK